MQVQSRKDPVQLKGDGPALTKSQRKIMSNIKILKSCIMKGEIFEIA